MEARNDENLACVENILFLLNSKHRGGGGYDFPAPPPPLTIPLHYW